ncbi:4'-phosphopantetheinyl transferase [Saccharomonospora amisosensis]|uniref:4'-phosphopantetheinyl transferase n=1 Tax=Saccharomonospora amisosensis TaxID=1128677 RepID=A0A7X5ULS9_9PSEU|nr:4'-phosphopantetheinyl transferase superfamily protein [Saccharomonospora amisosensis]NIJ10368.1 4'-phosphopantetheinyl transferase [Saccharomonospora amisosensis]
MTTCEVWWATPLREVADHLALLSEPERERYEAYRKQADRSRFLTGRVLAKTVAGRRLGLSPAVIRFDAACPTCGKQHGPPRLPGTGIALSISHAAERVGVAVTGGPAVGLDVESTDRRADEALVSYALNDSELATWRELPEPDRPAGFFTYWTRKEAAMKAAGKGLHIPLRGLTMSAPGTRPRLLESTDAALNPAVTRMADLDPGPGYRAAVAVLTTDEIEVTERWWSLAPTIDGQW